MGRPKTDHDQRRAEIARAACEVILEQGLDNARLTEIGARAGVTTGAVQHYFRNKEELLLFAKNFLFDRMHEKLLEAAETGERRERLINIALEALPTSQEAIDAYRVLEAFRGRAIGNATLLARQHERDKNFLKILGNEIELLRSEGLVAEDVDPALEALGLNALIDGLGVIVAAAPHAFKRRDLADIVARYVERVIGAPAYPNGAP